MPREPDLLERVRRARQRLADAGPTVSRGLGDFDRVTLPTADCDELRDLVIADDARVVIEIGLATGLGFPVHSVEKWLEFAASVAAAESLMD